MTPRIRFILVLICIFSAYLSLKNLDSAYLWDDESECAIFAKNYLQFGKMTAWDGRNLYAYRNGSILDANLRTLHPPLDIITCAASFKVFGVSTGSARLPFVLAGWLALWVFYLIVKTDFGEEEWLWLFTVGGLALSTVFLLNIRTCRYNSLSILFSLATYYGYKRYLLTKKMRDFLLLVFSSVLSFYTNPMICGAFLVAMAVVHWLFYRKEFSVKEWKVIAMMVGLFLLAVLPYAISNRVWHRPDLGSEVKISWLKHHLILLWWNLSAINFMTSLPWMIAVGLGVYLYRNRTLPYYRMVLQWITLAVVHVIIIALLSPQSVETEHTAELRYLVAVIPFLTGIAGMFLYYVSRTHRLVGIFLFLIYSSTNLFTLTPKESALKWSLPSLVNEVHYDYPTPVWAVSEYLKQNAHYDSTVACYPDYNSYPLMFYMGDSIRISCILTKQTHLTSKSLTGINAPLFLEENFPEWLILLGYDEEGKALLDFFQRRITINGTEFQHKYERVTILDYYWYETQRPEWGLHTFGPKIDFNRRSEGVYIFHRIEPST